MTPHLARSLTASFGLHAALIGLAALFVALNPLVSLDPAPLQIVTLLPGSHAAPAAPSHQFIRPIPQPAPTAAPAPVLAPESQPAPVSPPAPPRPRPTRTAPPKTPAVSPTSTPAPSPQMSYEEFIQQHGQPTSPAPIKPKPGKPVPQISPAAIIADITTAPGNTQSADPDFISVLVAQLQAAFATTGPWPENLSVTISFKLGADGRLQTVKITTPSQHPAFDAAARNACRQLRLAAVPSSATTEPYQITFRSVPR